jgi:hypothetical protein
VQGAQAPHQRIFYGSLLFLPAFKQGEMEAKKIKRQNFFIEVLSF